MPDSRLGSENQDKRLNSCFQRACGLMGQMGKCRLVRARNINLEICISLVHPHNYER